MKDKGRIFWGGVNKEEGQQKKDKEHRDREWNQGGEVREN